MRQWITFGVSIFACFSIATSSPLKKRSNIFDSMVVFGDSYSDNGSLDEFYSHPQIDVPNSILNNTKEGANKLQKEFKKEQRYRRSNGPLLVEYLADYLETTSLYDFARSGATANNSIVPRQTQDVDTQTLYYLKSNVVDYPKENTLFLTWIGVNDIHDIFIDNILSNDEKNENIQNVIETARTIMNRLYKNGARYQAILGLIPIEQLPLFNALNNVQRRELQDLIEAFNTKLNAAVNEFNTVTNGDNAYFVDLHKAYLELYGNPRQPSKDCSGQTKCDDLIWWDEWHPTTKTHKELAGKAIEILSLWIE